MGKRIRPDFLSQHFPDFLLAHQMKRIRFHDLRHPYVKHTTKIYPAKAEIPNHQFRFDSLGFLFLCCISTVIPVKNAGHCLAFSYH